MENRNVNMNSSKPALRPKVTRALIECGLWVRVMFIGASGVAAGLAQLLDGEGRPLSALALILGGGAVTAASWWRGRTVLDTADQAAAVTAGGSSPAGAGAIAGT